MTEPRINYDELLAERVRQLQAIDERLEKIASMMLGGDFTRKPRAAVVQLRHDLADMIRVAEAEHAAF